MYINSWWAQQRRMCERLPSLHCVCAGTRRQQEQWGGGGPTAPCSSESFPAPPSTACLPVPPCAGSQTPNGEAVGFETEAYAILDTLAYIRPDFYTLVSARAGDAGDSGRWELTRGLVEGAHLWALGARRKPVLLLEGRCNSRAHQPCRPCPPAPPRPRPAGHRPGVWQRGDDPGVGQEGQPLCAAALTHHDLPAPPEPVSGKNNFGRAGLVGYALRPVPIPIWPSGSRKPMRLPPWAPTLALGPGKGRRAVSTRRQLAASSCGTSPRPQPRPSVLRHPARPYH